MNMMGTPSRETERSLDTARSTAASEEDGDGYAIGRAGEVAKHGTETAVDGNRDTTAVVIGVTTPSSMKNSLIRMLWWVTASP